MRRLIKDAYFPRSRGWKGQSLQCCHRVRVSSAFSRMEGRTPERRKGGIMSVPRSRGCKELGRGERSCHLVSPALARMDVGVA